MNTFTEEAISFSFKFEGAEGSNISTTLIIYTFFT